MSGGPRRILRRVPSVVLWYGLPACALATVAAYIVAAIALHVNPPVVPIQGVSMRPTLQTGELVFLEGVDPKQIHKGDVIAVNVPKEARQKYSLPGRVVHRVIKIEQTTAGPVFQTKGDGNAGPDVFTVHSDEVVGRMAGHVAGLGYPLLFFRSTQGKILLGAIALIVLLYFLIGLFEERQATVQGTAVGLQAVLAQTEEIKQAMRNGPALAVPPAGPAPQGTPASPEPGEPTVVVASNQREENAEMLDKLLAAVGEYGEHLRSHTAVMQGLAQATTELRQATEELRLAALPPHAESPSTQSLRASGESPPLAEQRHADAAAAAPAAGQHRPSQAAPWTPAPIEPRTLLLLAVGATATAVYLRRRLRPVR